MAVLPEDIERARCYFSDEDFENQAQLAEEFAYVREEWRQKHKCITTATTSCVYIGDGTKVILKRLKNKAWLENVPQAVLRAQKGRPNNE